MDSSWKFIENRMKSIDKGLLRFRDKIGKKSFVINNILPDNPSTISFTMTENEDPGRLINHSASLTQKSPEGYLYITGLISGMAKKDTLLMIVSKAFWFVKKGKGKSSWLEEACVYEQLSKVT
jgi:hypothetical protein